MKLQRVQIYTNNQQYINHCSSEKNNKYAHKQHSANISFMANVSGLSKSVFVQRNIIKPEDSLSKFVDRVFNKIYQSNCNAYEIIKNPPTYNPYIKDLTTISYKDIYGMREKVHATPSTQIAQSDDLYKYMESLISKGTAYQKQALECINIARTKIHDILQQYGFNPKELHDDYIDVKSSIYKRFDELLSEPTITKYKDKPYRDVIVLQDKENTDAVITLARNNYSLNSRFSDGLHKICKFNLLYEDSKIRYNSESATVKTEEGNKLSFTYRMPCKGNSETYNSDCIVLDNAITTLKSLPHRGWRCLDDDLPFYDIKDYKNNILYTFKNNDGVDELVSIYDLNKDVMLIKKKAIQFVENKKIALGTSLYTNLLQPQKPMGACIVLPYDIRKTQGAIKQELEPHILNGVGTGFNLSQTEEPVKVLTSLNEILKDYDGKTQRPPAGIAILDVSHKDILSFINAKRDADFNDWRFNISVSVPNDFMQKVTNDEIIQLTDGKEVKARSIYNAIINSMHYCGEPGIVFKDRVESTNPIPNHIYKGMASCAEIGLEDGEMCLFSHINLNEFLDRETKKIDFQEMGEAASTLSKLLDSVIDINLAEKVGEDNIASQKRRFGIGVCGFADLLANMGVPYGSQESQKILADCLEVINYSSKKASMQLAKEKGKFPLFDESRYNERDFLIKHSEGSPITKAQWDELYNEIQKYGLRNATTTALPPTGSSSRIVGASYSIEPYFGLQNSQILYEELDKEIPKYSGNLKKHIIASINETGTCQNLKFLSQDFRDVFRLGSEINYEEHLKLVGTAQKFVDDGISKTINFENSATVDDIDKAVKMAYDLGLKGIAVFRDGCLAERK